MKTFIIATAFTILVSLNSYGQLEKGYWIGDLSGGLTFNKGYIFKTFTATLNSQAMILVSNKLAVGGNLSYGLLSVDKYDNGDGTESYINRNTYLEIGPVARNYFGHFQLKPFIDLGMGLQMNHNWTDNRNYGENSTNWNFYARPVVGIAWWINDKVSLNLSGSYTFLNFKDEDFDGVRVGVSFTFGNAGQKN